jgi:hypothetical protein
MSKSVLTEEIEQVILFLRGQKVILDADLAKLYGVTTKRFNEAVKRNRHRFPDDFAFQLSAVEFSTLRSQIATTKGRSIDFHENPLNWSQFATSSSRHRGSIYRPWAFTEHGALMAANVLRSERAVQVECPCSQGFRAVTRDDGFQQRIVAAPRRAGEKVRFTIQGSF